MTKQDFKQIAVIGDWHLAFVTSTVLADVGHEVQLVKPLNLNKDTWKEFPPIPVLEPGLEDMIKQNLKAKRLSYSNGVENIRNADFIWLGVDTPVTDQDEPLLAPLIEIAQQIAKLSFKAQALIVSSQIPLGFCRELEKITGLSVVYVPENLRLGQGIETFLRADRTIIGSDKPSSAEAVQSLMAQFKTEFVLCNSVTAEMIKHANNAFLATCISFANEFARIGEKFGVDSVTVGKALKLDKRIGKAAYVIPGLGFAGGTLPRDLRVLQQLGRQEDIPTQLVDAVLQINENTTQAISESIQNHISKNNLPKSVLILGYTYKADTNTLRRSLSLDLAQILKNSGFEVFGFDPIMNDQDLQSLKTEITHLDEIEKLQKCPSAILLMTARPIFTRLNWEDLSTKNSIPCLVLDTQNFLSSAPILKAGFIFKRLWSPAQYPQGEQNAHR